MQYPFLSISFYIDQKILKNILHLSNIYCLLNKSVWCSNKEFGSVTIYPEDLDLFNTDPPQNTKQQIYQQGV